MTWFVDEYLDKTLRNLDLCPGCDIDIRIKEDDMDVDISVFWHAPSINLDWYPICQIDMNGKTIFHHEGAENPDAWGDYLSIAADMLADALNGHNKNA